MTTCLVRTVVIVAMASLMLVGAVAGVVPVGAAVEVVGVAEPPVGLLGPEEAALLGGLEELVVPDMIQKGMAVSQLE